MLLTSEASSACAVVSARHVLAGSPVHAGVGLAFVVIDIAVLATPARFTGTFVSSEEMKTQVGDFLSFSLH